MLSEAQIQKAREVGLLDYLQTHEPHSIRRCGKDEYCLTEHDSFKMSANGKFYWFSKGLGGHNALDFLIRVRGIDFVTAVQSLTGGTTALSYQPERSAPKINPAPIPPKAFTLPAGNANNDQVYAYLRGRGISKSIINRCINDGILYESVNHRCVFVGKDGDVPKFACERGTMDGYKKDVFGSDKRYSFCLAPQVPDKSVLAVFEAPVDALAHHCIHEIGQTGWDGYRLSLGGVGSVALVSFLERHHEISSVLLCLDNDKAGKDATDRIIRELLSDKRFSGRRITVAPPPIGKDYADTLQAIHQLNREKSNDRPKEAVL